MTEAEIMLKLGLHSWDEQRRIATEKAEERKHLEGSDPDPRRSSGRTTQMLVEAVRLASEGYSVAVIGYSDMYSRTLVGKARRMCIECGVDGTMIRLPGVSAEKILHDHYYKVRNLGLSSGIIELAKRLREEKRKFDELVEVLYMACDGNSEAWQRFIHEEGCLVDNSVEPDGCTCDGSYVVERVTELLKRYRRDDG